MQFKCPMCKWVVTIDDRYAGQHGPCTHCGKFITAPTKGRDDAARPAIAAPALDIPYAGAGACWFCQVRPASDKAGLRILFNRDQKHIGKYGHSWKQSRTTVPRCAVCLKVHGERIGMICLIRMNWEYPLSLMGLNWFISKIQIRIYCL